MVGAGTQGGHDLIGMGVEKVEAVAQLARRAGLASFDARGDGLPATLAAIEAALGRRANLGIGLHPSQDLPPAWFRLVAGRQARLLAPPRHLSLRPEGFGPGSHEAYSPDFRLVSIPRGYLCLYPDGPLIVTDGGRAVVSDLSSPYAPLIHQYDADLRRLLADAVAVNGDVVCISDDVWPLNFSHWMVDWLPRLAALGELCRRPDTYVAVPRLNAAYQWDTLKLCGFDPGRVIELRPWQAVRARTLLTPDDLATRPHPGHKAAAWVLNFLRGTIGYGAYLSGAHSPQRRQKLFVSRGKGVGRRVVNEDALEAALRDLRYHRMEAEGLTIAQQIARFAAASHVVAPHGAGLANIVFAAPDTTLVEMFAASYGTAAYYVLSAGLGMTYASYVSQRVVAGSRPQIDDFEVDVDDFLDRCGALL